jgi:hypothetical protein
VESKITRTTKLTATECVMAGTSSHIFEFLLETCPSPPASWFEPLRVDPDARHGPANSSIVLAQLLDRFGAEPLIRAGVIEQDDQAGHRLCAILGPEQPWLALRSRTGQIFDLVGESGCLLQRRAALLGLYYDRTFRRALDEHRFVVVTPTMPDMLLMRQLGIPVATCSELQALQRRDIDQLRRLLVGTDAPSVSGEQTPPIEQIFLAGWSFASESTPSSLNMAPVMDQLRELAEVFDVFHHSFYIWSPTPDELRHLCWARELGNRADLLHQVLGTLQTSRPLISRPQPAEMSLGESLRELLQPTAFRTLDAQEVKRSLMEIVRNQFTLPLIEEAHRTAGTGFANRKLDIALLTDETHEQLLGRLLRRWTSSDCQPPGTASAELDDILARTKVIEKLIRMESQPSPARLTHFRAPVYPRLHAS